VRVVHNGLNHACQNGRHPQHERGLDLYETPSVAVAALLRAEQLPVGPIWECAAGRGAIVRALRARGHQVIASDVSDRGFHLDFVGDFLATHAAPKGCGCVLTNPPFQSAEPFVAHALSLVPTVFMLLRLAFLESERRTAILENSGLRAVHVFRRRLPMMHRDGWNGNVASSAIPFAWYCWERGYAGPASITRI
jgi:hypothetical protein